MCALGRSGGKVEDGGRHNVLALHCIIRPKKVCFLVVCELFYYLKIV